MYSFGKIENICIRFLIFISILFLSNVSAFAQTLVSGTIKSASDKSSLVGVSVFVESTNIGTTTNKDGYYSISLPNGKFEICFSYMGFKTEKETINVKGSAITLNKVMFENAVELKQVVVSAKSEARKIREQAMPISVITMEELQGTVSDVSDVLSKTSGVQIRSSGGVGSSSRISVRGLEGKRIGFFINGTPLNPEKAIKKTLKK
ncbi:MAG: TonB-dependent receptor [Ignavibacteria bacterium]|nr:TonB-dependent receptor [Ignavibacteria bacterium]